MNKLIVSGYLTQDPVLKQAKSGISYTTINMVNKDNKIPVNLAVMVFGKDAEVSCKYLTKARSVEIEAKIETDQRTEGLMYVSEKIIFGDKQTAAKNWRETPKEEILVNQPTESTQITDENF